MKPTCLFALLLAASAAPTQAQTAYRIDPTHSALTYDMAHPAHSWSGTSHEVSGRITMSPQGLVTAADVAAPVVSFESGNRNRDSHMAEVVEFYAYPSVSFHLTRLTPAAPTAASDRASTAGEPNAVAEGALTFHGVTRPVRVPVLVEQSGSHLHVVGQFELTLTEFRLERPSLMMVKVRDWLRIHLDLTAVA